MELSRHLEVNEYGILESILQWEDEIHTKVVTGVTELKELLILE